jgi:NMD protein affecting ribosome stability and mRNA decay
MVDNCSNDIICPFCGHEFKCGNNDWEGVCPNCYKEWWIEEVYERVWEKDE